MNAIAHNEFAPPPTGGFGRSLSFALFMHLLLLGALTWGIHWKTEPNTLSASAELWSAVPAEAAPAANEPEPTLSQPLAPPAEAAPIVPAASSELAPANQAVTPPPASSLPPPTEPIPALPGSGH